MSISEFSFHNYRNFDTLHLKITAPQIIITGDNGSGKTNILEAISFLSPGRGLRYAKLEELSKIGTRDFCINVKLHTTLGPAQINIEYSADSGRRVITFNGSKISHNELTKLISLVWLTPQMDGLFLGPSSDRRRFLDRACYAFVPTYASLVNQYEHFLKERMKILESPAIEYTWLDMIEENLSIAAASINTHRMIVIEKLQNAIDSLNTYFPKARLELTPSFDIDISVLQSHFKSARAKDIQTKRSNFGPHRSDLAVYYANKNMLAKYCSTGEQKSMLISIIIAQIAAKENIESCGSILLLDETFVHLDETRRTYLAEFLNNSHSQIWITSAELSVTKYFTEAQVVTL